MTMSPATREKSVCVIGAGIVGLTTAWQLLQHGHRVTVIDQGQAGQGTSAANGAQLSYDHVAPLADPSIWAQLPKLLLAPDSPLKLRLQADPQQWAWGLQFLAACRRSVARQTTAHLLQLGAESRLAFERLMQAETLDCHHTRSGKLVIYGSEAGFAAARRQMELQRELGSVQSALTAAEAVAVEPALAHHQPHVVGAIHTPGDAAADCQAICHHLRRRLIDCGAQVLENLSVSRLEHQGGRVVALHTSQGAITADAFVLAAGTGSVALARPLGVRLPVYPLKGYSLTLDVAPDPAAAPHVSVTDASRKVVFARLGHQLRVAGMAELVGHNTAALPERVQSLVASTRALFPQASRFETLRPWAGLRPATPTGRPIVGRWPSAPNNLWFNTGHGALGFTLSFGSAERLARAIQAG